MKQRNGSRLTDSQSKEKLSNGVPSYSHSPGTSPPIKDLRQSRRAIKEETIAINRDWVYNHAC